MNRPPIIDAHHHLWRLAHTPWLNGPAQPRIFGDYEPLRRDYPIDDYLGEVVPQGVVKSVYIQVNVAPGEEIEEIEWVDALAVRHGFPHASVGFADLAADDVASRLDRLMAAGNLHGIRQQLHWHENPAYRFAARPDLMNDAAWRTGLREVEQRRLLFELQIFAAQMTDAAKLARAYPRVEFVLLHAGMLEERSADGWARWREGMSLLAECPNVSVKLSGLGTFEHSCSVELWQPVIDETLTRFGAERCLFGSNFPIEKLWTTYDRLVEVILECLVHRSTAERQAIFHDNAARLYRL
ncbi:MAG: amidohydrolase family protein [Proteobacteria bacterium]|nr:amidohydrolase family protein [Burkholderiales bacterium]